MSERGKIVAFLGPDGSGKSTLIEQVRARLEALAIPLQCFHWRVPFKHRQGEHRPVTDPHAKPPRSQLASALKLLWLLTVTWLSWLRRVFPARRQGVWIILDRCFDDLICDPRRYRYGGPMWLARLVARLMPHPDMVVVLQAPSSVIRQRKCEVSVDELERQLAAYEKITRARRAIAVDATSQPEAICARLLPILGIA